MRTPVWKKVLINGCHWWCGVGNYNQFYCLDLETKDKTIKTYEIKVSKLSRDLEEMTANNASMVEASSMSIEALQQQIDLISNERNMLKSGMYTIWVNVWTISRHKFISIKTDCEALQKKINEAASATPATPAAPETPSSGVKVSSLGAKKPRAKRGKGDQPTKDELKSEDNTLASLESQITLLNTQRDVLEGENASLKTNITNLEEKLSEADSERHTLQKRVELLMAELSAETNGTFCWIKL